jgi:sugar lactone lactonase YvrE
MNSPLRILWLLIVVASVLPTSRAEAHEGWGILVDATGRVYFADIPANIIWRISKEGKLERVALGKHSHALVLDSAGNVYGTNPHLTLPIRSVWRLTPHGQLTDLISPTEHFPLGLQSFIMDGAGSMYSVNARNVLTPELLLLKRNHDGEITTLAGSSVGYADGTGAQARFMGIDGMAWGPDGALYLTDGPYVRRVALDGTVTTLGSGPLTERKWDEDLLGIDVDASGDVYVADHANRRILRVTLAGAVSTFLRTGSLWTPTGVAVAPDGLYVLEHLRMPLAILGDLAVGPYLRVRKVSADGKVTELARIWGRRSVAAGSVMAAVVSVIVGAKWFRSRRRPANTPLQPTSGAGTPSTSNMP